MFTIQANAQLRINEACGKNNSILSDPFGSYTDWVEIHNPTPGPISLSDHYLSDDPLDAMKWQLPAVTLAPGAFYLLFAEDGLPSQDHFPFRLQQAGETITLADQFGTVQHSLNIPYLRADHAYGSHQESPIENYVFDEPTPGASNSTIGYLGYTEPPQFSPPPGVRSSSSQVSLLVAPSVQVKFTLGGQPPNAQSVPYSWPLGLNGSQVIGAIAFKDSMLPSEPVFGAYIVEPNADLPIVSLSCHPDSLFDDTLGIYMTGVNADTAWPYFGANFWSEREIPVNVEFFGDDGSREFQQLAGLRIHGGRVSRTQPQRPIRLTARTEYGNNRFEHHMFPDREGIARYKRLILRNSGADFCLTNIRDGLWHKLALEQGLDVDVLAFRPSELYLNGQYWGMMHIRERIDEDHLEDVYGVDAAQLLLMEEEDMSIQGDSLHFDTLLQHIVNKDMSIASEFAYAEQRMDLRSMKDYFALEIFAGNADWPGNNLKFWKPSITTGKWRYLMYDLDATMMALGWIPLDIDVHDRIVNLYGNAVHSKVYLNLLENDEFKRTYVNRFADLINTAFQAEVLVGTFNGIVNDMGSERMEHWSRWCGNNEAQWNYHTQELLAQFFSSRQGFVRDQIENTFLLQGQVDMQFDVFPINSGEITINTITPMLPFHGVYFDGNPIDVSVVPQNGYVFDRWEFDDGTTMTDLTWQKNFTTSKRAVAYFRRNEPLHVYPSQFTGLVTLAVQPSQADMIKVEVTDMAGRIVSTQDFTTVLGMNHIALQLAHLRRGMYLLSVQGQSIQEVVRIQRE